jgi:glutathione S-transferase
MPAHALVALVTLVALLAYLWMGVRVAGSRKATGVRAPAMTGDPILERHVRVQANTLEWLPLMLAPMWLFAVFWNDRAAALLGAVWIVGRVIYALGYVADPAKRTAGFMIQGLACLVLIFGALGRIVYVLATLGA